MSIWAALFFSSDLLLPGVKAFLKRFHTVSFFLPVVAGAAGEAVLAGVLTCSQRIVEPDRFTFGSRKRCFSGVSYRCHIQRKDTAKLPKIPYL